VNPITAPSTSAVDSVFWFIIGISAVLLLGVTAAMIYFAIRYHHKRHPEPEHVPPNTKLEIAWTLIPVVIVLAMFWYGYRGYLVLRRPPADSLHVTVMGQMWQWSYQYDNGKRSDVLYAPEGRPIKLTLKSLDVIHSFYIPAFRIKEDAVPGRDNYLWFKPEGIGPADVFCAEYCGVRHAYMLSKIEVIKPEDFYAWLNKDVPLPAAGTATNAATAKLDGRAVFQAKGCLACHSTGADRLVGPGLGGLFGRKHIVVVNGTEKETIADADYLRRSLTDPAAELAKGYANQMLKVPLTDAEMAALLEYMKTLK